LSAISIDDLREDIILKTRQAGGGLYGIVLSKSLSMVARALPSIGVYKDGPDADRWANAKKSSVSAKTLTMPKSMLEQAWKSPPTHAARLLCVKQAAQRAEAEADRYPLWRTPMPCEDVTGEGR
jgi:hypothetical protein